MKQPALPENNCERFCYPWMRLELWGVDQMGGMSLEEGASQGV